MVDYVGKQLGNYQLTRRIGEGAFAHVYLGEHVYLGTQAAIKVLNTQSADYPMDWFRNEARTIARLVHPNIVRVLEFGVVDNTPFLVLDYAPNGSLREHNPYGRPLPLPSVISYAKQAAEALQYVHDEKLIHRDVKPENLLLGRRNEVLLSDFGIALMMQTFHSGSIQEVSGTLPYMAPEQIQGRPTAASDQYSLGVIVYEWLAGKRPFDGSLAEIMSQHLVAPPPPLLGKIKLPAITPAIEQVVMTALEKDPTKRFGSVRAFANALEQASQLSTLSPGQVPEISAIDSKPAAPNPSYRDSMQQPGEVPAVRPPTPPVYSVPARPARPMRPIGTVISNYRGHQRAVRSLSWSPNSMQLVSASDEKTVHVWEAMTGKQVQLYQDVSDAVRLAAWSPGGSLIAIVGADALVRVWDFATGRLLTTYRGHVGSVGGVGGVGGVVSALSWSPQQYLLASAASDNIVHVWDATTGKKLCTYHGHLSKINMLAWSPNAPLSSTQPCIVSGGDDAVVRTWEATTGKNLALYYSQPAKIVSVAWSPSVYPLPPGPGLNAPSNYSSRVACGREDGMVEMWDTTTDREVLSYRYTAPISVVVWSPDGTRFAYASDNNTVEVWDTRTNLKLFVFSHTAPLRAMAWSPDGRYIASGGDDATIQVWVAP